MATRAVQELVRQRKHEAFVVWVDALRLRGAMRGFGLGRLTKEEWDEYEKPTAGAFNYECVSHPELQNDSSGR